MRSRRTWGCPRRDARGRRSEPTAVRPGAASFGGGLVRALSRPGVAWSGAASSGGPLSGGGPVWGRRLSGGGLVRGASAWRWPRPGAAWSGGGLVRGWSRPGVVSSGGGLVRGRPRSRAASSGGPLSGGGLVRGRRLSGGTSRPPTPSWRLPPRDLLGEGPRAEVGRGPGLRELDGVGGPRRSLRRVTGERTLARPGRAWPGRTARTGGRRLDGPADAEGEPSRLLTAPVCGSARLGGARPAARVRRGGHLTGRRERGGRTS